MKLNQKLHKIFFLLICVFVMSGFSLLGSQAWDVSPSDRTVWVRFCGGMQSDPFSNNLEVSNDPLGTNTSFSSLAVMTSIINDYNSINSSSIRLALYPDDPANPGTPADGDSVFTLEKAKARTIEVCYGSSSGSRDGEAEQTVSGKKVTGCKVTISPSLSSDLRNFLGTTTHEIGHCLGLDHPMETTKSIMSYFRSEKDFRLMSDDKMGIVFQYAKAGVDAAESNTFGLSYSKK